jgi:L-2-hydroxyglutarate oxidase LhgO
MENIASIEQTSLFPRPYRYVMDACSIISQKPDEANRRKVHNSLWLEIEELIKSKAIVICSEIKDEVEDVDLKMWLAQNECTVLETDNFIQQNVAKVVNENPQLLSFTNLKSSGDAFLIASAMTYGIAVITEEEKKSPKRIPKICESYNIPCYNIIELADKEGWQF